MPKPEPNRLDEYRAKRKAGTTPEPFGGSRGRRRTRDLGRGETVANGHKKKARRREAPGFVRLPPEPLGCPVLLERQACIVENLRDLPRVQIELVDVAANQRVDLVDEVVLFPVA